MAGIEFDGVNNKIELNTGAAAADQHILFNGNAQDFYIALDDSADDLIVGLGSTIGTTPIISLTEAGAVTLKNVGTGDDNPMVLTLQTSEIDMAADDVIGKIAFQAPDEGTGTDAVLVAAAIQARSEGDFSSSSNATELQFMTGASEAATTKMTLSSAGKLGIGTDAPSEALHVVGDVQITDAHPMIWFSDSDDGSDSRIYHSAGNFLIDVDVNEDVADSFFRISVDDTEVMKIDSTGAVTMPLQPAFGATSAMTDIPLTTLTTITLTERFDTNADLASNTFTAPVAGKYYLGYHFYLTSLDADHTVLDVKIITSNKTHSTTYKPDLIFSGDANFGVTGSQICDMDASDTATFGIYIAGGAAQTDIHGDSTASGMLIG